MPVPAYGPQSVFNAIMQGKTDLLLVGDSQSIYSQYRGMHGWTRNLPASLTVCGRVWSGAVEADYSGTKVQTTGTGATGANLDLIAATTDSEAVAAWSPRDSYEVTFTGNMTDGTRIVAFKSTFPEVGMYPGGDPFVSKRVKMWSMHRASNATQRLAGGGYRLGTFVNNVQSGSYQAVAMGTGGGLEKSNASIIIEADQYTVSTTAHLELRVVPIAGGDETGDVVQWGGAVMHGVDADGNRLPGLVFGSCGESGWAASTWNTNFAEALWVKYFTATTTGSDTTVLAIMLGHNAETGDFTTNLTTLMSRLRGACFTATGKYPMFLLIAPWESDAVNSMDAAKDTAMKALVGLNTTYGDVAMVSLYEAFGAADPGMVGLHPASNTETDLVWGKFWRIVNLGPSMEERSVRTVRSNRTARYAK